MASAAGLGGGYIIDAPPTGAYVERIPMNTSWCASTETARYARNPAKLRSS